MAGISTDPVIFEHVDRGEHFDGDGGGSIVRTFYVEPYTAHKAIVLALKGTVKEPAGPGQPWTRIKPHNDPIYEQYYVTDVKVEPLSRSAIRGCKSTEYQAGLQGDALTTEIKRAASTTDDFDLTNTIDQLTPADITAGGVDPGTYAGGQLRGQSGAFITATYNPLIFIPGLSSGQDEFDYVDPIFSPMTKLTQLGRDLQFIAPSPPILPLAPAWLPNNFPIMLGGISDTQSIPEVLWEFSVRRLMVPRLPMLVIGYMSNRYNDREFVLGDIVFPAGTVRMDTPEIEIVQSPDAQTYYNITYHFTVRRIWETFYNVDETNFLNSDYEKGWISWNHQLGIPSLLKIQTNKLAYYPAAWVDGLFQIFGQYRGMYIPDTTMAGEAGWPAAHVARIDRGPFESGFKDGE